MTGHVSEKGDIKWVKKWDTGYLRVHDSPKNLFYLRILNKFKLKRFWNCCYEKIYGMNLAWLLRIQQLMKTVQLMKNLPQIFHFKNDFYKYTLSN